MIATRPAIQGTFGMVASTHWLASAAGMAVLEAGGNAADAAVAAGFALQVAEPHLNGPGGDMTLLLQRPGEEPVVLCGQGVAPAAATLDAFAALDLTVVPGSGLLAAAVPGSTLAWLTLLRDAGTKRLDEVLAYAIGYAERGVPVLPSIARSIAAVAELLADEWTTSAAIYLPGGRPPAPGAMLRNPTLAATYRRLLDAAVEPGSPGREAQIDAAIGAWTTGFVADAVDTFARAEFLDSSGQRHAGLLTGADMAAWRPSYEPAVLTAFDDWVVAKAGPWTQGPAFGQQLRLLAGQELTPGSADFVHLVTEAAKLAFADREAWYGDASGGVDVPLAALLSAGYADERRALIGPEASFELRPGAPAGRTPRLPAFATDLAGREDRGPSGMTGEPTVAFGGAATKGATNGDTCHVDVVDRWGLMISATPSGGWLTSSPVIGELGFPLGTRLQMTALEPGLPTSLTPGRRPRSTLSPSMASRADGRRLAFGTPGGDQQDQWQLTFFLHLLRGTGDLQETIDLPMFHTTHFPSSFYPREAEPGRLVVEERVGPSVLGELRRRGHDVVVSEPWSLGRLCAVGRDSLGVLTAAADPRGRQGYAAGR